MLNTNTQKKMWRTRSKIANQTSLRPFCVTCEEMLRALELCCLFSVPLHILLRRRQYKLLSLPYYHHFLLSDALQAAFLLGITHAKQTIYRPRSSTTHVQSSGQKSTRKIRRKLILSTNKKREKKQLENLQKDSQLVYTRTFYVTCREILRALELWCHFQFSSSTSFVKFNISSCTHYRHHNFLLSDAPSSQAA